ncbi:GAF domain-containing protein [Pseudonocardia yuanmonensis]|uniref:GAF domain-containing protein n=1 Tax=Pseudonocardia yuanmonensis TaxID=1095914 RepID=UPI0031EEA845
MEKLVASRDRATRNATRILAESQQRIIDAELRMTRNVLLRAARADRHAIGFLAPDFLAVADLPTLYRAILDATATFSDATSVDLLLYDQPAEALRIVAQRGFASDFLASFGLLDIRHPTACTTAFTSGGPVLVDDVGTSPIFARQSTRDTLLAAGSRAVQSYPLPASDGTVLGVLSFHHPGPRPTSGKAALIARSAALALGGVLPHSSTGGAPNREARPT